jgi:hypothetical protein
LERVRDELRRKTFILKALENFASTFRSIVDHLQSRGAYHRQNLGQFVRGLEFVHDPSTLGDSRPDANAAFDQLMDVFNETRRRALALLGRADTDRRERSLSEFLTGRAFA